MAPESSPTSAKSSPTSAGSCTPRTPQKSTSGASRALSQAWQCFSGVFSPLPPFSTKSDPSASPIRHVGEIGLASYLLGAFMVNSRYHTLPRRVEDDYVLHEKVLGTGCNGEVRLATGRGATGAFKTQKYAVKAFKLTDISAEKRLRLNAEIEVFLGMDHPHIARLYDVYESDDHLHLVMECLEGGELFDRVTQRQRYSEQDAAQAMRQMLLAVNYMHTYDIAHRDLKLENFLYDDHKGDILKLIDFGFSKVWDANIKEHVSCGTLSYVAPEVLLKRYTKQCDLWSLGVIAFILLAGYMPFAGSESNQKANILKGRYTLKRERWSTVSAKALNFVKSLLEVDPQKRLTAEAALEHPWLRAHPDGRAAVDIDESVVEGLRRFSQASKFRRCCLTMMAWSLSHEDRSKVRGYFVAIDKNQQGTICLSELKAVLMDKFHISERETLAVFDALDSNDDGTIHYNDFLAAMLNARIDMHDDLLRSAFRRFDTDSSGYITIDNMRQVFGDSYDGVKVEALLAEADLLKDNRISYPEFVSFIRGTPLDMKETAATKILDKPLQSAPLKDLQGRQASNRGIVQGKKIPSPTKGVPKNLYLTLSRALGKAKPRCSAQ